MIKRKQPKRPLKLFGEPNRNTGASLSIAWKAYSKRHLRENTSVQIPPSPGCMDIGSAEELIADLTDITRQLYVQPGRRSEFIQLVRDNGKVIDFESQIYRRDRNVIWISESARVVRDEVSDEVLYYEGMVQDITRRKAAEEERDQANARLSVQYAVARTLAEVRHLGEASNKIVQAICESVGWDFGDMWRIDPEANLLRCVDMWHAPEFRAHEFIEATRKTTFEAGARTARARLVKPQGLLGAGRWPRRHFPTLCARGQRGTARRVRVPDHAVERRDWRDGIFQPRYLSTG